MGASLLDIRFLGFLCLVVLLRLLWPKKFYPALGAVCSAALIGLSAPATFIAIVGFAFFLIVPLRLLSFSLQKRYGSKQAGGPVLVAGIGVMVVALVIFKAYRQFSIPWLGGRWLSDAIPSLIGFSYFVFRAIDYLHIQIIVNSPHIHFWELIYYLLFPPTITSGPIQKFLDFLKQASDPQPLSKDVLLNAGYRIARGFFRKTVIAAILDRVVQSWLSSTTMPIYLSVLILASLYLYFYFDFAGYSDIAIGFGLLLGIRVPENFRKPFLATSITEFWRNWHITLVDWFRDHVFIPLGGMRGSRFRGASLALFIMLLCGLWHGLTVSMIAWGLWHGLNMFLEAILGVRPLTPGRRNGLGYGLRVLWTNARAALGCIFFLPSAHLIFKVLTGFAVWR